MARPRLIVLNVIVLFFNPDVAIALAFENRFCPPYFFLFPFSFFFLFFLFSLSFSPPPPPLRPVLCRLGRAVPGLCCPPAAARGRPVYRHTDGARAAPLPAAQPRRPPRVWIKTTVALPPPAASPRGDVSWWLCPAQWHDDPVRLCVYLCIPLELEEPFRLLALHQDQREAPAQPKPWVPSPPTAEGSWYNGVFVLWTSAPNARPSGCDPRAAPTPLAPR